MGDPGGATMDKLLKKSPITEEELSWFQELLSDMFYVAKNLASTTWIIKVNQKLKDYCDDEKTISEMWKLREYIEKIEKDVIDNWGT